MGTRNFLWNFAKKFVTFGLITVTITDRYVTVVPVRGGSMSPTFNSKTSSLMGNISGTFLAKWVHKKYKVLTISDFVH